MDIPKARPQGIECPSLLHLLITSYLPIPHPSSFLPHIPSLCPLTVHSAFCPSSSLSLLLNLPSLVSQSLFVLSPWPHLSFSFSSLIFFYSSLIKSSYLAPIVSLSSISTSSLTSFFPLSAARPVHLWISIHIRDPGDSADTTKPLTSLSSAANRH